MVGGENAVGMGCVAAVNKFDIGDDDASLIEKIAAAERIKRATRRDFSVARC